MAQNKKSKTAKKPAKVKKTKSKDLRKVAIFCLPGHENHFGEVVNHLGKKNDLKVCITQNHEAIFNEIKWADVIWIEWANEMSHIVTSFGQLLYQKQVILRLHSYEAFTNMLDLIHWSTITDLIFVAEHIKRIVLDKYPVIKHDVDRIHVIPNGIDMKKFKLSRNAPGKNIAYLGYLNFKKGTQLLFTAFAELYRNDPQFKLYIGGAFQEERYVHYMNQMKEQNTGLAKNIIFDGWVAEPEKWLQNKSHIISTSLLESQHKSVMEAMAMGLKPLIHNFVGAKEIYPTAYVWSTLYELCNLARSKDHNPVDYSRWVERNYNLTDMVKSIDEVLDMRDKPIKVFKDEKDVEPVTVAACMIMKNEEKNLGRCLESVKDFADEIVIVDTGSTDKSIEIAESYGAKVYHHEWENDFSVHRNQSIGYVKSDWLLIIDCDEELVGEKEGFKKALSRLSDEYDCMSIGLKDANPDHGNEVNLTRVFKTGEITYRRAWHNVPITPNMAKYGSPLFRDVNLIHYGSVNITTPEEDAKKADRTLILIDKSLESDPNDWELYFYKMQFLGHKEDWEASAKCGEIYLSKRNEINGFNLSVFYTLIRIYSVELKNIGRATQLLNMAQQLLPEDIDIAFVTCEMGVMTGNGQWVTQGASQFARLYKVYKERPDAKAGRFCFHFKPESLLFCMKHLTAHQMTLGVNSLKHLQGTIAEFPDDKRVGVESEIAELLEPLGVDTK